MKKDKRTFEEIILEIKAEKAFHAPLGMHGEVAVNPRWFTGTKVDKAQIINSLKISHHKVGLLINFGEISLRFRRFIN